MRPETADLALAAGTLLLAAATLGLLPRLGLGRSEFLRGSLRSGLQLALLGLFLAWLLPLEVWPWQAGGLVFLALLGAAGVSSHVPRRLRPLPLVSLLPVMAVAPLLAVSMASGAAGAFPTRLLLPLAGFLIGNGLAGAAAFVNGFAARLRERRGEVEARLALGALPREAARDVLRDAGRVAFHPTLQAMAVVGLAHAPALLAGGVAAGMHPLRAALLQFLVLQMAALGSLLASLTAARLAWDSFFTRDLQVRDEIGV